MGLAVGSAIAAGIFFVVMDQASEADPYWAAFLMRFSYFAFTRTAPAGPVHRGHTGRWRRNTYFSWRFVDTASKLILAPKIFAL